MYKLTTDLGKELAPQVELAGFSHAFQLPVHRHTVYNADNGSIAGPLVKSTLIMLV